MLNEIISRYGSALEQTLRAVIDNDLPDEPDFGLMLRYAMGWVNADGSVYAETTGKRLRPYLLLLSNQTNGGNWQNALHAAAAVELLHNFSLIHDDIQDRSEIRHNRPTVWQVWGIPNAINAGDAMFSIAYSALSHTNIDAERMMKIWRLFNQTNLELTRGQHLDMRFEHLPNVPTDDYISMIKGKSAALLATCAKLGALIAKDDDVAADAFYEFGLNLGIAFQIRDDILGIWGDPAITGKSAATDIISRKKSLPILYGLEHSARLQEIYALETLNQEHVEEAIQELDRIDARAYTNQRELGYYDRAMTAIKRASLSDEQLQPLHTFIDVLLGRNY